MFGSGFMEFDMVNPESRAREDMPGCTKLLFSVVLRQILIDSAVSQLLFGCCTLVPGKQCFAVFGTMEIPQVRLE